MKTNQILSQNFDFLRIQVQNYECQGCSHCSQLPNYDLRSKTEILGYLITKRTCFLTKIETRIEQLNSHKERVEREIEDYREVLESLEYDQKK